MDPWTKDIQINNAKRLSNADDTDSWEFSECDHFLGMGAALSSCGAEEVRGLIFDNQTYEVYPMTKRMMELFSATNRTGLTREPRGLPHLIKMADKIPEMEDLAVGSFKTKNKRTGKQRRNKKQFRAGHLYIETALFLDAAAYQSYSYFYSVSGFPNPDIKIRDLVLSWMNSIQALYHFPSLGTAVDFSIVRLEIHKTQ
ncbi:uncharacterized protein LOC111712250, partial [Eurytemora carolleeae]|uniref:uncharacterized protein LOC111712250 n=1 Tax=Eurytemora carolleeae TaxID=1294199 RepID=UPI000C792BE0